MNNLIKAITSGGGIELLSTTQYATTTAYTIPIDMSKYVGAIIYARGRKKTGLPTTLNFVLKTGVDFPVNGMGRDNNGYVTTYKRYCRITDTSIYLSAIDTSSTDACEVLYIYGVRGGKKTVEDLNHLQEP